LLPCTKARTLLQACLLQASSQKMLLGKSPQRTFRIAFKSLLPLGSANIISKPESFWLESTVSQKPLIL
jgi:hypothetical protein